MDQSIVCKTRVVHWRDNRMVKAWFSKYKWDGNDPSAILLTEEMMLQFIHDITAVMTKWPLIDLKQIEEAFPGCLEKDSPLFEADDRFKEVIRKLRNDVNDIINHMKSRIACGSCKEYYYEYC